MNAIRLSLALSVGLVFGFSASPMAKGSGELIAFVQPGRSAVAKTFASEQLPQVRALAEGLDITLTLVDVRDGAPADITTTPTLVFQNHLGRSFYYGRLTTFDRIGSFLRTAAIAPQGHKGMVREDIAVREFGRANVALPIKIAALTGYPPPHHDRERFVTQATGFVMKGLTDVTKRGSIELSRTDRSFYMDFNPWLSEDGILFLSTELYSQFHCKKPVFRRATHPYRGPWEQREELFIEAASDLMQAVTRVMKDDAGGDGFDPVAASVPIMSWQKLGLALPIATSEVPRHMAPVTLTRRWQLIAGDTDAGNAMVFHFPAPLDGYAGQVGSLRGTLDLGEGLFVDGATGRFEADPASVTMGEPDLDDALRGAAYLDTAKHPVASFEIRRAEGDGQPVAVGVSTPSKFTGVFSMKGVEIPVIIRAVIAVSVDSPGIPRLNTSGSFTIPLAPFDLEGPDGPDEASKFLEFQFRLAFEAASDK